MRKKSFKLSSQKFQISAFVVTLNEEKYLRRCLNSIDFCDDIVVIDLGSTDDSVKIASEFTSNIHIVPKLFFIEAVRSKYSSFVKNNWIISIDPDEYLEKGLVRNILESIKNDEISVISVPWKFFFKNRPLKGTIWARKQYKEIVFNLNHVRFKSSIIEPFIFKRGFRKKIRANFFLNHNWVEDFSELKEKIERYAKIEGEEKFNNGVKYSFLWKLLKSIFWFIINFFYYRGFVDGKVGFNLSFYYAKYIWNIDNRLRDLHMKKK